MHVILLEPLGEGWAVRSERLGSDMAFLSGSKAEAAATQLGQRLAEAGHPAQVHIYLRGGALAGRFAFVLPPSTALTQGGDWRRGNPRKGAWPSPFSLDSVVEAGASS